METLSPGSLLGGRYKIQRVIGEGATGAVYLARDARDRGRIWAIKELYVEADDEAEDIFRNEIRTLRSLRHPAIPALEDAFDVNDRRYLVMERVEGPTLEKVLDEARGPLPEEEVLHWGLQLCDVLAYLHGRTPPVIYRDLKPSNCMLTRGGVIKIVDLGIARRFNPSSPRDTHVFGTPGYCAPEQYHGRSTSLSDVYSLGATMYVLLSRTDPAAFNLGFPPLRRFNARVSLPTEETVRRALERDAGDRFPSAAEMREALERCVAARTSLRGRLHSFLAAFRRPG